MKDIYDVLIVGAGPAGCELARDLSKSNLSILLTDRVTDLNENNFSSAGVPIEFFDEFSINEDVIRAKCNKLTITTTGFSKQWESDEIKTAVMDFSSLRKSIADEAICNGVDLRLGLTYMDYSKLEDGTLRVKFITRNKKEEVYLYCRVLVDATGPTRSIMDKFNNYKRGYITGTGIEYLIETRKEIDSSNLQFFLGGDFMPNGYAWIFPMDNNRYKVGVGSIIHFLKKKKEDKKDLEEYLKDLIVNYLKLTDSEYEILDKHGGSLIYSYSRKDTYFKENILAIGDAVSTVHPLGGEGIRYALRNARLASKHIQKYFKGEISSFKQYKKEAKRYLRKEYFVSQVLALLVYGFLNDKQIRWGVRIVSRVSFDMLIKMLFYNRYSPKAIIPYIFRRK